MESKSYLSGTKKTERIGLSIITALWLSPMTVLACDSDAAPGLIDQNRLIVQRCFVLSASFFVTTLVLYFIRGKKGLWVALLSLFFLVFIPCGFTEEAEGMAAYRWRTAQNSQPCY